MTKKSRKAAAKYSELSREKKKKQRSRDSHQQKATLTPRTRDMAETATSRSPVSRTAPKPQAGSVQSLPGYEYVRGDLRRIGILAGTAIVILIVLTFILG